MIPGTKCLGRDVERPRPGGTVEVIVSPTGICCRNWAHAASEMLVHRFNRPAETGVIFFMIPGTSCLATIVLSLLDKNRSPFEAPGIILALIAPASIPAFETGA